MPFAYYGAKHDLAKKYPRPRYQHIIEPFAGSAAYSCHWAHLNTNVTLCDLDPLVIETWDRLKTMTASDLDEIDKLIAKAGPTGLTARYGSHRAGDSYEKVRTRDPLVAGSAGGSAWQAISAGNDVLVTHRIRTDWRIVRQRIEKVLPHVWRWQAQTGDFRHLPNVEATWFIDPPYQPVMYMAGKGYTHGSDAIDYADELADWCRSRMGQVIVCEQSPASWLPFTPIGRQRNAARSTRTEVAWFSDQHKGSLL